MILELNIWLLFTIFFAMSRVLFTTVCNCIDLLFRLFCPIPMLIGVVALTPTVTSGYCVFQGENLISWSAKRQPTVSKSSAEADYRAVDNAVSKTCWIRNLLLELHCPITTTTLIYCDNVSAAYLASNLVHHHRTKHIEIDIHFVREKVKRGDVRVFHVPTRYQIADTFTKGLPQVLFDDFRSSLSVCQPPDSTAGCVGIISFD